MRVEDIGDGDLRRWALERLASHGTQLKREAAREATANWTEAEWAAFRRWLELGGWGEDEKERGRRQLVVQRFIAKLPRREIGGVHYDAGFSYGAAVAALLEDMQRRGEPQPLGDLPGPPPVVEVIEPEPWWNK